MEHTITLQTRENGHFVKKTIATDKYFTVCPHQDGDSDFEEIEVLSIADLYAMWQELKVGDRACGEKGWKYRFYRHKIVEDRDSITGKLCLVDYVTQGKVYRRGNKVYFAPVEEGV
jgi:hypothetical protein